MHDLLEVRDQREHREHRFHQHAVLPLAALTQFEVRGITLRRMEGGIAQDNHALFELLNEPLKGVIRDISGGTRPPHHQPPLIQQETEFPADNPPVIREAFAANLLRTPALPDGMDQLDPIRVDAPEHRWIGQEGCRPRLMGAEEAKEAGPLREAGKQRAIVARQPAIKRPVASALERMQHPQGHNFTRPQRGVGMCGDAWEMVIDPAE